MKKIQSLFQRNYEGDRLVRDEVVPGSEWVQNGEGIATEKWDGTACLIKDCILYKRYDAKNGKTPPEGFIPAQDPDPVTGHWPGWLKVGEGKEDQWHREGLNNSEGVFGLFDGTYELIGPKVQGNRYKMAHHELKRHGGFKLRGVPTTYEALKEYFLENKEIGVNSEGIVWHHRDGRMVKIKAKDFGIK